VVQSGDSQWYGTKYLLKIAFLGNNYPIEKDLNSIARSTGHTNVGFVGLLRRHDKPWMNRKVRSVNLRLDRAL
jgi:hypothetical protein